MSMITQSNNSLLKSAAFLAEISAAFVVASAAYGILYLYTYFQYSFGIQIFQFIDASELLFIAPASTLGLLILTVPVILTSNPLFYLWKKYRLYSVGFIATNFFLVAFLLGSVLLKEINGINTTADMTKYLLLRGLQILVISLPWWHPASGSDETYDKWRNTFQIYMIIAAIIAFPLINALSDVTVNNSKNDTNIKLRMIDGRRITSGKDVRIIGKTAHYWFIYHKKNRFTRIEKVENVKEVEYFRPKKKK